MKYRFCSIRIIVTNYDVKFATNEGSNPNLPHPLLRHWYKFVSFNALASFQLTLLISILYRRDMMCSCLVKA